MKKLFLLGTMLLALMTTTAGCYNTSATKETNSTERKAKSKDTKIQVAILLDTSGSMSGLIEQAKSRLWNIVNTLTTLKYQGKSPVIEIALYEYGSYNRYAGDYIRQITPLTTDLDLISQELFALSTGGSEEFCGTVISRATSELEWGGNESDMKLIYIAGNEIFEQGRISYKTSIPKALNKNIYINTIHCGDMQTGIRDLWKDAANRGKGKFFNIDHNARVRYIETPYDDRISHCNEKLNETYIGYGSIGSVRKETQMQQDVNAKSISSANYAERAVSKSKSAYSNSAWDLVDKVKDDKEALSKIKESELPKELQGKSKAEIAALVKEKETERTKLQKEIEELAKKRQAYVDEKSNGDNTSDDLGKAISESILAFANQQGYTVDKN